MTINNSKILIVDDDYGVRKNLEIIVKNSGLQADCSDSGYSAIEMLSLYPNKYNLVLLDVNMEGLSGFDTARAIGQNETTKDIPIIFITANTDTEDKRKGFEAGCVDYITKPFDKNEVAMRIKLHLELSYRRNETLNYAKDLENKVKERTFEIKQARKALIVSLSNLAESRDPETGAHIQRTQEYSKTLAMELMKLSKFKDVIDEHFIDRIYDCSPLHDIGKVGIPDYILLKPGGLTSEEFSIMKRHAYIGYKTLLSGTSLLSDKSFLEFAAEIAYCHHEKYNGLGYPRKLKKEEIPLPGRIMAISDVYDALISKRVYKEAWKHDKVVDLIKSEKGEHFDPDIVDAFLRVQDKFHEIKEKYCDEEE